MGNIGDESTTWSYPQDGFTHQILRLKKYTATRLLNRTKWELIQKIDYYPNISQKAKGKFEALDIKGRLTHGRCELSDKQWISMNQSHKNGIESNNSQIFESTNKNLQHNPLIPYPPNECEAT